MGRLVVVEGLDGAGKRTFTDGLAESLVSKGLSVFRLAFPRYGQSIHADLVRDAMYLRLGDAVDSVYGMTLLFALDRRDAAVTISTELDKHDIVLVDRYIASNAAYGSARLHQDARGDFVKWLHQFEVDRFGLRIPDLQLLYRVPAEVAADRAKYREKVDSGRARDSWESDFALQSGAAEVYDQLVDDAWLSAWHVVDGTSTCDFAAIATTVLA